jgi:pimeloyl-ACP methyl ester carboxylesterase
MRSITFVGTLALLALVTGGCTKPRPEAQGANASSGSGSPSPAATTTTHSAALPRPARTGAIETVEVPNDRKAIAVVGHGARPIVYLHGMCSEPRSDVEVWASTVSELGTVIALDGDAACSDRGGRTYSTNIDTLDARIDAAIRAVNDAHLAGSLDDREVLLIGESLGASRAIALANRAPSKYTRLVLVGGPETPSPKKLAGVKAVALLAGEKDAQDKMKLGASGLESAGITARFWELPDAIHGEYGPEGARLMGEAVGFVSR